MQRAAPFNGYFTAGIKTSKPPETVFELNSGMRA